MSIISIDERRQLCEELGIDPPYLYQLLTGRREMAPLQAVELEAKSGRRLRRWHLRAKSWHRIWPELIGAEGAPAVPNDAAGLDGGLHAATVAQPPAPASAGQNIGEKF